MTRSNLNRIAPLFCLTLFAAATTACSGSSSSNPLIGSWKFQSTTDQSGAKACAATMVFTSKQATITNPPDSVVPGPRSMAVTYVPSATLVSVITSAGVSNFVNYKFPDKDHMYTEDAWGKCYYQRAD